MTKFFSLSALLLGVVGVTLLLYVCLHYRAGQAPSSPVVLFASYESGVNGTLLKFHTNGTFEYENMGFAGSDIVAGYYTRTDSLIRLDRLPQTGLLKRATLLVRSAPFTETGQGIWQLGATGRVDSTLVVFTIFPFKPVH
jgi:hypothetical protein